MLNIKKGDTVVAGLRRPFYANNGQTIIEVAQVTGTYGGDDNRIIAINDISDARDAAGHDVLTAAGLQNKNLVMHLRGIRVIVSR